MKSGTESVLRPDISIATVNIAKKGNPPSAIEFSSCQGSLIAAYPEYETTTQLDELRDTEYAYLDKQHHVYLDYTGSGLAASAQYRAHEERLASTLCGNPHSINPTSEASTHMIDKARARVLDHLNASSQEYTVIFTQNATGAARLIGEAYPFNRRTKLVLTSDNHNSINGLREFARRKHTRTVYIPTEAPDLRIDPTILQAKLGRRGFRDSLVGSGILGRKRGLFVYPAQSNFSGVRHPLSWVKLAQEMRYDVLLDVAAYLPTAALDLSTVQPEFLIVSWYKLFGYPTGVGCLICKHSALAKLDRPWFSGGTVKAVSVNVPWHAMAPDQSAFEDGTMNFLSIPDVTFGLDWLEQIGMHKIETRVRCLTGWFLNRLQALKHNNGSPMVRIYGPRNTKSRGGTVAFNFLDLEGKIVDERIVAAESSAARISLRTGCFCNPGVAEYALNIDMKSLMRLRHNKDLSVHEMIDIIGLPSAGCIRVSFGLVSNVADVDDFFDFAVKTYRNRITNSLGHPSRNHC